MSKQFKNAGDPSDVGNPPAKGPKGKGGSGTPYSVTARRERSCELAQKRRTNFKAIMDDLTQVSVSW